MVYSLIIFLLFLVYCLYKITAALEDGVDILEKYVDFMCYGETFIDEKINNSLSDSVKEDTFETTLDLQDVFKTYEQYLSTLPDLGDSGVEIVSDSYEKQLESKMKYGANSK